MAPPPTPVVFIHGLWMHASHWDDWAALFTAAGYPSIAPGWPGEGATVIETRRRPEAMSDHGIGAITEHYQRIIADLPATPVVIGHGMGGLIAQRLLSRDFARACVALEPSPFQRILRMPACQMTTGTTRLDRRGLRAKSRAHTAESYHHRIGNGLSREESDRLFQAFSIPAPSLPLRQVALANLAPCSEAAVKTRRERGPLLMIAGSTDRTTPAAAVYTAYKVQCRNAGVTQLAIFDRRGHSLPADRGWREIADTALRFLHHNGL
jgi:non-heme chloroperoxidase